MTDAQLIKHLRDLLDDEKRMVRGLYAELHEVEQVLGKALGYPPYPVCNGLDHTTIPATPTDAPDSDWVCIGDNTAASLADEAAAKIKELQN